MKYRAKLVPYEILDLKNLYIEQDFVKNFCEEVD